MPLQVTSSIKSFFILNLDLGKDIIKKKFSTFDFRIFTK